MTFDTCADFFDQISSRMTNDESARSALKDIGASYQFNLTGDDGGSWTLDLAAAAVTAGESEADCTVTMEARDFLGMINREEGYQGQQLFMMGKLILDGDLALAMQLEQVMSQAGA